jgi:sugar lactone lactonase YvrE
VAKQGPVGTYSVFQTLREGFQSVYGMVGANGVRVSPDDQHVYVTGGAVIASPCSSATPATGSVRFVQVLWSRGDLNLKSPNSIAVAPDGTVVVGTSQPPTAAAGGVVTLNRKPDVGPELRLP